MRYALSLLAAGTLLAFVQGLATCVFADVAYHHVPGVQRYVSPDHKLRAVIVDIASAGYQEAESIIKIETPARRVIAARSYYDDEGGGHTVVNARWTPDSRFFVYSLESSGGHSPWHSPTHFYSRRRYQFFGIDDYIEGSAITSPDFRIGPPSVVWIQDRDEKQEKVNLRRLECIASVHSEHDNY